MARVVKSDPLKICDIVGVVESLEGFTPELWRDRDGKLVIRIFNEGGNARVDLDFASLVNWLKFGPNGILLGAHENGGAP